MIPLVFDREYSPTFERAVVAWHAYHAACEEFDAPICSGRSKRGVPVPMGNSEYQDLRRRHSELYAEVLRSTDDVSLVEFLAAADYADRFRGRGTI
jgi:hypothetical protein